MIQQRRVRDHKCNQLELPIDIPLISRLHAPEIATSLTQLVHTLYNAQDAQKEEAAAAKVVDKKRGAEAAAVKADKE